MNLESRIYVAGRHTLLGSAIADTLIRAGYRGVHRGDEPDLTFPGSTDAFFGEFRPQYVFLADGLSGGIEFNRQRPATLMQDNLTIASNVLDASQRHGVRRLLNLGSSCMYPREATQPLSTAALGTGLLEPTSAPYATAKLAAMTLVSAYRREFGCDFLTAIVANAFGPGDEFGPDGHVLAALLRRAHEAKMHNAPELVVWGSGRPIRDFIYAPDAAAACVSLMRASIGEGPINIGSGTGVSIADAARLVCEVVGYLGRLVFDTSKPDGQQVKILDTTPINRLGWKPATSLSDALRATYHWFMHHEAKEGFRDAQAPLSRAV